jgi:energy-coupling factor transport system substrate-specific component
MIVIENPKLRGAIKIAVPFVLIPAAIIAGAFVFREKSYAYVSLVLTLLSLALFIAGFEKKRTGTRRLIIVAVMIALSVVGRFIPFFKPITALTVLTALYLGGEAGFLVGALSAVISNFYFGQGPWTPFQMFAWGMIGLIAGLLASPLKKSRVFLLIYVFLAGAVYSLIMDVWTVMWYNSGFNAQMYLTALATAVPYTVLYAASNVIFILIFAKPFGEKLERIKIKYGV